MSLVHIYHLQFGSLNTARAEMKQIRLTETVTLVTSNTGQAQYVRLSVLLFLPHICNGGMICRGHPTTLTVGFWIFVFDVVLSPIKSTNISI